MERDVSVCAFLFVDKVGLTRFPFASNEYLALLQFGETVLSCRGGRGVLGGLVDDFESGCGTLAEDGAYGAQTAGDKGSLAGPVVVEVAVDRTEVIGKIDIDSSGDHSDEGEKEGVCCN